MRRTRRALVLALFVAACVDPGPAGLQQIAEDASRERFGGGFAAVVTEASGERTVGVAGQLADGSPMSADAPWVIGSVSKAFVATAVMQLVDEGKIALTDLAREYLAHDFIPDTATVFDLLHHSSGISNYVEDREWVAVMKSCPKREPNPYDHVAAASLFEPGTQWAYSNTNYLLLGELIQAVTGDPVEVAIRDRILDPLDLSGTYLMGLEPGDPPMAASQDFFDTGPGPLAACRMERSTDPPPVDGGYVSTARDLDTFYRALFGGDLVSEASLAAMMRHDYVGAEFGQGLGISRLLEPPVEGVTIYANGGGVVGYKTLLLVDLESMTTIVAVSPNGFAFENQMDELLSWAFG